MTFSFADQACKVKRFQPNELTIIICVIKTLLNQYYRNDGVFYSHYFIPTAVK